MLIIRNIKYYGNTSTEYGECKDMIEENNHLMVRCISLLGSVILLSLGTLTYLLPMIEPFRLLYFFSGTAILGSWLLSKMPRCSYTFLAYLQVLILYAFSTGLALAYPDERSTVSVIMLPLLSMLLIDRFDRIVLFNMEFTAIYCILVTFLKNPRIGSYEVFGMLVSLVLSLFSNYFVQSKAIRNMLSAKRNQKLIIQLHAAKRELQLKSEVDQLSGLLNRGTFVSRVEDALKEEKYGVSALCLLDIDHFKEVNDTYGHQRGDEVISAVASALRTLFGKRHTIGRIGGDEFVVYLSGFESAEQIGEKMRLLNKRLNATVVGEVKSIPVSVGISLACDAKDNFEKLYHQADQALYLAKRGGRNQNRFFEADEAPRYAQDTAKGDPEGSR